ncbi:transmembrane protein 42-like [Sycon ciliatum]|uniref:transmembrane protein 42-like n=1 Tax=Sycon ciliatum TaxID=27933 RepID=UPI0031F6C95A|eukprot:scpid75994/ scgid10637/ Transmembrane protein 42
MLQNHRAVILSRLVTRNAMAFPVLAFLSGFLAALASLSAKLASSPLIGGISEQVCTILDGSEVFCKFVSWSLSACCFGVVLLMNSAMWTVFVSALEASSSTVEVTVINTTANFISSAALGWLVFGETLSLLWWAGAACMLSGLALYQATQPAGPDGADAKTKAE